MNIILNWVKKDLEKSRIEEKDFSLKTLTQI
jgi:hypothetical protein